MAKEIMDVKRIDGWRVAKREEVKDIDFDYLIICNVLSVNEIIEEAVSLGLNREKMIPSRTLKVPYFNWERYDRIRKSRLSIISANCWGGICCHTLGMECLSPFKNLWVSAADIIKMMPDFAGYMAEELLFARWEHQPAGKEGQYPVMFLRDIEVHFNHYQDVEKATADWMRRRCKINYDNLLVMIYTEQENEVESFIKLKGFHKICFVPEQINHWKGNKDVCGMTFMPGQSELWDCVNHSVYTGRNSYVFDIFKMLEGKQSYRYEK